jgi:protocatechuate 3,4-dioxygenase beta subunit
MTETGPQFTTTSGSDGQFRSSVPKSELEHQSRDDYWNSVSIVAVAEGFGFDQIRVSKETPAQPLVLKLTPDAPIRGRILDIDGQPVANARIRVKDVRWTPGASLESYLAKSRDARVTHRFEKMASGSAELHEQMTGSDGHFTLTGIGAERYVRFEVVGETIEHTEIEVVTRDLPAGVIGGGLANTKRLYAATFEHVAAPSRPLVGTVRDAAAGQPLA